MDSRHVRGRRGEAIAARYLEEEGWEILAQNWRDGHRELDLVARRGSTVAFVEVKTRQGDEFGHPFEAITPRKRREVETAARAWIRVELAEAHSRLEFRFDALAVCLAPGSPPVIEHLPDAWRPGGPG